LLAAACYARGSVRFYNWLLNNKYLGSYIKDWRTGRGIPLHAKIIACLLIAVAFGYSIIFVVHNPIFEVALILLAIWMSLYIVTRPTRRISNKDGG
ncbi:MAG: YbaN family protein, partial [candidate division Zixibacteria bacterium]|nr:YbaN family protein [candidate division Zixibacteria bacterium]